jgi:hypothetical protein
LVNSWWSATIQKDTIYLSKDMLEYKIIPGTHIVRIRQTNEINKAIKHSPTMKI